MMPMRYRDTFVNIAQLTLHWYNESSDVDNKAAYTRALQHIADTKGVWVTDNKVIIIPDMPANLVWMDGKYQVLTLETMYESS